MPCSECGGRISHRNQTGVCIWCRGTVTDPEYSRRHYPVKRKYGKASQYECRCGEPAEAWAQIHDTTGESAEDYEAMCVKCHNMYDYPMMYSKERNQKVGEAAKRMWAEADPAKRERMNNNRDGHSQSEETRRKISESKKGKKIGPTGKRTPEQCERIRIGRWGR